MTDADDVRHMRHALALGARRQRLVSPRPSVGCVIVNNGRVVGRGATGTPDHAEALALKQAGDAARGATAYVTLEPCAHHGRTPPCADALVDAGIARVVIAIGDPNPKVNGRGIARLREAGVSVDVGVMADEATRTHRGFLSLQNRQRAALTLKLAMTLDGRIATASGESQWITGAASRREVHAMRARHDGVLVGGGTARDDDPTLTVRDMGIVHQPVRIIASRHLNLPFPSKLSGSVDKGPVWLMHGPSATESAQAARWRGIGADCHEVQTAGGQLDPADMLTVMGQAGVASVFCEGGGTLAASFLLAGLVDELVVFSAGAFIGAEGLPGVGALGLSALAEAPRFELAEVRSVGADVMLRWSAREETL